MVLVVVPTRGRLQRKVDQMKYATVTSIVRDEIRPFGGCWPIVGETAQFIIIEKTRKDRDGEEKTQKKLTSPAKKL